MVKKILPLIFCLLVLCSCSKAAGFEPERYIDAAFTIDADGFEISGNVKVNSYEDITFTFTSPEGLTHMTLKVTKDSYLADIGGVRDELSPGMLPDNAPIKLFAESLKTFLFENNEFEKTGKEEYCVSSEILGETVTAAFDAEGLLKTIRGENTSITIKTAVG
ncbi:MAG: hypothetical protein IJS90_00160 [Clostridia bacterium]|nr:hypothetical protein [Clostridia bacterium]